MNSSNQSFIEENKILDEISKLRNKVNWIKRSIIITGIFCVPLLTLSFIILKYVATILLIIAIPLQVFISLRNIYKEKSS